MGVGDSDSDEREIEPAFAFTGEHGFVELVVHSSGTLFVGKTVSGLVNQPGCKH